MVKLACTQLAVRAGQYDVRNGHRELLAAYLAEVPGASAETVLERWARRILPPLVRVQLLLTNKSVQRGALRLVARPTEWLRDTGDLVPGLVLTHRSPQHHPGLSFGHTRSWLQIDGIELVPQGPARAHEAVFEGQVLWADGLRDHSGMGSNDMAMLGQIPCPMPAFEANIAEWSSYLAWRKVLAENKRWRAHYTSVERKGDVLRLTLAAGAKLEDLPTDLEVPTENGRQQRVSRKTVAEESEKGVVLIVEVESESSSPVKKAGEVSECLAGELSVLAGQAEALERLRNGETFSPRLGEFLFDPSRGHSPRTDLPTDIIPIARLTESQGRAVQAVLGRPDLLLIPGPPGTGKTTVIAQICYELARRGERVLVASQTNLAVDNVFGRLVGLPSIRAVRLGREERLGDEGKAFAGGAAVNLWFRALHADVQKRADALTKATQRQSLGQTLQPLADRVDDARRAAREAGLTHRNLESSFNAAMAARDQLDEALQGAVRQREEHLALSRWTDDPTQRLASVEDAEVAHLAVQAARAAFGSLPASIRGEVEPMGAAAALEWLSRIRSAIPAAREVQAALMDALARCNGGVSNGNARDLEAEELLCEKERLSSSEDEVDLRRLGAVNRRLRELSAFDWARTTQRLVQSAGVVFGTKLPEGLERVIRSLEPKLEWCGELEIAAKAAGALAAFAPDLKEVAAAALRAADNLDLGRVKRSRELAADHATSLDGEVKLATNELNRAEANVQTAEEHWKDALSSLGLSHQPADGDTARQLAEQVRSDASNRQVDLRWAPILRELGERLLAPKNGDRAEAEAILEQVANVVGVTCTEAWKLSKRPGFKKFDVAIIDEASKVTPPELVQVMLLAERFVVVGDHRQLPPTFRERADNHGDEIERGELSATDFERYRELLTAGWFETQFEQSSPECRVELTEQFRMHPEIMAITNQFYGGRLRAGSPDLATTRRHGLNICDKKGGTFITGDQPVVWVDTGRRGVKAARLHGTSFASKVEVEAIGALLTQLDAAMEPASRRPVAVISFYGAQVRALSDEVNARKRNGLKLEVAVDTVDRFQGGERPIVIVSLVRDGDLRSAGFVKQYQRLNVALSRAQELLIIVGHCDSFVRAQVALSKDPSDPPSPIYQRILDHVRRNGGYRDVDSLL